MLCANFRLSVLSVVVQRAPPHPSSHGRVLLPARFTTKARVGASVAPYPRPVYSTGSTLQSSWCSSVRPSPRSLEICCRRWSTLVVRRLGVSSALYSDHRESIFCISKPSSVESMELWKQRLDSPDKAISFFLCVAMA